MGRAAAPSDVWSLRGIAVPTRQAMRLAAAQLGITVGMLVDQVLSQAAHQILNQDLVPEPPSEINVEGIAELLSALRALEQRVLKLEADQKSTSAAEPEEENESIDRSGTDLILRLLHQLRRTDQKDAEGKLMSALMVAAKAVNDPLTSMQLNRAFTDFRAVALLESDIEQRLLKRRKAMDEQPAAPKV